MDVNKWPPEYSHLVQSLSNTLGDQANCPQIIDTFEHLINSIWTFIDQLLGDAGARAILSRSIEHAARKAPLAHELSVGLGGIDFSRFRSYVTQSGCSAPEVMVALVHIGIGIFQTLDELTGQALTDPLLRYLEEQEPDT